MVVFSLVVSLFIILIDIMKAMPQPRLDPQVMRASAGEAAGVMKALANPERLLLLCEMSQGEVGVSELEARLGIQQPTLSQQLGVLRRQGLVETRRDGKQVFYRVADARVLALLRTMYAQFCPKDVA